MTTFRCGTEDGQLPHHLGTGSGQRAKLMAVTQVLTSQELRHSCLGDATLNGADWKVLDWNATGLTGNRERSPHDRWKIRLLACHWNEASSAAMGMPDCFVTHRPRTQRSFWLWCQGPENESARAALLFQAGGCRNTKTWPSGSRTASPSPLCTHGSLSNLTSFSTAETSA